MADPVARKVRLYGRVQGVFFRQWLVHQARELSVAGWVRNAPDGSVEAHVEGDETVVEKMIEAMSQGPTNARVEDLMVEDADVEEISGFAVRI